MNDTPESRTTENLVEAILFWKGEPLTAKEISKILKSDEATVKSALDTLVESLKDRGIVLQQLNGEYSMGTCPEASQLIEEVTKEELSKDLGKASLETLSIILYKGAVRRSDIDHVRGVNSTFILRNLLIRGLITKKPSPTDSRTSIYEPSIELLSYLGVDSLDKLPNLEVVKAELENFHTIIEAENPTTSPQADSVEGDFSENKV